jgi:NAD(P)H-hydrate epimerase
MVHAAPQTAAGTLRADCLEALGIEPDTFSAVAIGPGLTVCDESAALVDRALRSQSVPLLLDADALNVCSRHVACIAVRGAPTIITPHPGEMARLMDCTAADVQGDRCGYARKAAATTRGVVVLKGAGTIVAQTGLPLQVNLTGNPGMASGGMGDVLSGLVAGLLCQGLDAFDASRLGVWLHGRAADRVAERTSQSGLTAGAVIEEIPVTYRELTGR